MTGAREVTVAPRRLPGLDGIRALAILLVVAHNYHHKVDGRLSSLRGGYIGVTLFFALSGFLITSLLLVEHDTSGRIRVGAFYVRRIFRLLPALLVALAMLLLVGHWTGWPLRDQLVEAGSVLGYFFNWWHGGKPLADGWGPLWSLSVEEQFYLVWPLILIGLLWLVGRRRQGPSRDDTIAVIVLVAAAVLGIWRTIAWMRGLDESSLYDQTHFRSDALLIGAAAALLVQAHPRRLLRVRAVEYLFFPAVVVFGLLAVFGSRADPSVRAGWMIGPGETLVGAIATAIVVLAVAAPEGSSTLRLLEARPMVWLGTRSYAIYLFHGVVAAAVDHALGHGGGKAALISVVATGVAAELSHRFVEQPVLRRVPIWARRSTPAIEPTVGVELATG